MQISKQTTSSVEAQAPLRWALPDRQLEIGRRPLIMGIVNVTPDSFSDAGKYATTDLATAHGLDLIDAGADLLDIGGESTRPGAEPVPVEEELRRVVPVVERLTAQVKTPISVDTSKAAVARACLERGAAIINDVTGLMGDPEMPKVVRQGKAGVIIMHMQGTPQTMQQAPYYKEVVSDLCQYFEERIASLTDEGIDPEHLAIDPGIGFGKKLEHNLAILARLDAFRTLGRPICLGVSRKSLIGKVLDRPIDERLAGALAITCYAMSMQAVHILRVHDVGPTRDAVLMWQTLSQ